MNKAEFPQNSIFLQSTTSLDDESFITEVYRAYLLREPDENGKQDYLQLLSQGQLTREQMLNGFQNSPEFNLVWQSTTEINRRKKTLLIKENLRLMEPPILSNREFLESTAKLDDRQFITAIYHTFLLRFPDAGGLKTYTQALKQSQMTREQILNGLQNSPEFQSLWESTASFQQRQVTLLKQQQQQKETITICQKALELYENNPDQHNNSNDGLPKLSPKVAEIAEVYHRKAVSLAKTGQLSVAIASWEKAVELKPNFTQAWGEMGDALLNKNQISAAVNCYHQALKCQPDFFHAYQKYAKTRREQGKADAELLSMNAEFLTALKTQPHSVSVYKFLAKALVREGEVWGAIAAYQEAIKLESDKIASGKIYIDLGKLLVENHQWDEAINTYYQAIELIEERTEIEIAYLGLGQAFAGEKNWNKAIESYQKALEINPYFGEAYWHLGKALVKQNIILEAVLKYIEAIKYTPEFADLIQQEIGSLFLFPNKQSKLESAFFDSQNPNQLSANESIKIQKYYQSSDDWAVANHLEKTNYFQVSPREIINLPPVKTLEGNFYHLDYIEITTKVMTGIPIYNNIFEYQSPGTFVVKIPNGRYVTGDVLHCSNSAVITSDNYLLADISFPGLYKITIEHPLLDSTQELEPVYETEETVAVCANLGMHNYFHWMLETLPRIEILRSSGIEIKEIDKFLIDNNLPFQKKTLEVLGISEEKILDSRRYLHIKAKQLVVPSYQGILCVPSKRSCDFIRQTFLPIADREKSTYPERLYISRQNTNLRHVINDDEVIATLEKKDFVAVIPELMPLPEQISLFASAKIIVGPWGAWATNLVFCNPGSKVIGFSKMLSAHPCFHALCLNVGLSHYQFLSETLQPRGLNKLIHIAGLHESDMFVNINLLNKMIEFAEKDN